MAGIPGGLTPEDVNKGNRFWNFLARFAVEEQNKKQDGLPLQFVKVVEVQSKRVEGIMYYIILEAKDGSETKNAYEAKVFATLQSSLILLEFKLLGLDA